MLEDYLPEFQDGYMSTPKPVRKLIKKAETLHRKHGTKDVPIPKGVNPGLKTTKKIPADMLKAKVIREAKAKTYPKAKEKKEIKANKKIKDKYANVRHLFD